MKKIRLLVPAVLLVCFAFFISGCGKSDCTDCVVRFSTVKITDVEFFVDHDVDSITVYYIPIYVDDSLYSEWNYWASPGPYEDYLLAGDCENKGFGPPNQRWCPITSSFPSLSIRYAFGQVSQGETVASFGDWVYANHEFFPEKVRGYRDVEFIGEKMRLTADISFHLSED